MKTVQACCKKYIIGQEQKDIIEERESPVSQRAWIEIEYVHVSYNFDLTRTAGN